MLRPRDPLRRGDGEGVAHDPGRLALGAVGHAHGGVGGGGVEAALDARGALEVKGKGIVRIEIAHITVWLPINGRKVTIHSLR